MGDPLSMENLVITAIELQGRSLRR